MKVRMKAGLSGTRDGKDWPAVGEVMDLPDDEGASMCASGMAVPVADGGKIETATPPDEDEAREDETREALVPTTQAEQKPRRRG